MIRSDVSPESISSSWSAPRGRAPRRSGANRRHGFDAPHPAPAAVRGLAHGLLLPALGGQVVIGGSEGEDHRVIRRIAVDNRRRFDQLGPLASVHEIAA